MRFTELADHRAARIRPLAGGMKRRLMLARALLNDPRLLVLDEPTTGLDPQARRLVWERIRTLKRQGTTILLTTHYMEEAAQLCDRLIIMDGGRIVAEGTPAELVAAHVGADVVEVYLTGAEAEDARAVVRLLPLPLHARHLGDVPLLCRLLSTREDRKSTRLNSSHVQSSCAAFCLKKLTLTGHGLRD